MQLFLRDTMDKRQMNDFFKWAKLLWLRSRRIRSFSQLFICLTYGSLRQENRPVNNLQVNNDAQVTKHPLINNVLFTCCITTSFASPRYSFLPKRGMNYVDRIAL